jgi:hypothetical protein
VRVWNDLTVDVTVSWGGYRYRLKLRPGSLECKDIRTHVDFAGRVLKAYFMIQRKGKEALKLRELNAVEAFLDQVQKVPDSEGLREIIKMVLHGEYGGMGEETVGFIVDDIRKWMRGEWITDVVRGDDRKGENGNG